MASQKAVRVLQADYKEQLSADEMVEVFDIMLMKSKARIFIVMEPGDIRDLWLQKQLRAAATD